MYKNRANLLQAVGALRLAESPDVDGVGVEDGEKLEVDESLEGVSGDSQDEPLGEKGLRALQAERRRAAEEKRRADAAEAALKEIEDAKKSELELARERIAEFERKEREREAKEAQEKLRSSVMSSKNLPDEWAEFITGDTEDEMRRKADKIFDILTRNDTGIILHATSGKPGGSLEAGREAAKNFRR